MLAGQIRVTLLYVERDCVVARPWTCFLTELLLYVILVRMRAANLVTESSREHQDDYEGSYVHELRNHEHYISDGDRMTEKKR
jgi:hypothetical protein